MTVREPAPVRKECTLGRCSPGAHVWIGWSGGEEERRRTAGGRGRVTLQTRSLITATPNLPETLCPAQINIPTRQGSFLDFASVRAARDKATGSGIFAMPMMLLPYPYKAQGVCVLRQGYVGYV